MDPADPPTAQMQTEGVDSAEAPTAQTETARADSAEPPTTQTQREREPVVDGSPAEKTEPVDAWAYVTTGARSLGRRRTVTRTAGPEEVEATFQRLLKVEDALTALLAPTQAGVRTEERGIGVPAEMWFSLPRQRLGSDELRKIADALTLGAGVPALKRFEAALRRTGAQADLIWAEAVKSEPLLASFGKPVSDDELALVDVQAFGTQYAEALAFEHLVALASLVRARWPKNMRDDLVSRIVELMCDLFVLGKPGSWSHSERRAIERDLVMPLLRAMFPSTRKQKLAGAARVATDGALAEPVPAPDMAKRAIESAKKAATRAKGAKRKTRKMSPHVPVDMDVKPTRKPQQ